MTAHDHVARILSEWERERPDLDVSPQGLFGRLHRVANLTMGEIIPVYRAHALSEGEFDVLAALRRAGEPFERTPGALAEHTMITTGGMTKRIDRLVTAGLVTRRVSSDDGRARVIALTASGHRVIDAAFADHVANEHRLLEGMPESDRRALERILGSWLERIEENKA